MFRVDVRSMKAKNTSIKFRIEKCLQDQGQRFVWYMVGVHDNDSIEHYKGKISNELLKLSIFYFYSTLILTYFLFYVETEVELRRRKSKVSIKEKGSMMFSNADGLLSITKFLCSVYVLRRNISSDDELESSYSSAKRLNNLIYSKNWIFLGKSCFFSGLSNWWLGAHFTIVRWTFGFSGSKIFIFELEFEIQNFHVKSLDFQKI